MKFWILVTLNVGSSLNCNFFATRSKASTWLKQEESLMSASFWPLTSSGVQNQYPSAPLSLPIGSEEINNAKGARPQAFIVDYVWLLDVMGVKVQLVQCWDLDAQWLRLMHIDSLSSLPLCRFPLALFGVGEFTA